MSELESAKSFMKSVQTTMRDATKLKKVMLKKSLRRARAVCPECGGMLHGILAGRRDHLHMHCDGSCKRSFME